MLNIQHLTKTYSGKKAVDDLAQPIASYSHGMKQKLAIISAWLHQPRLIIMDEPFVGLLTPRPPICSRA